MTTGVVLEAHAQKQFGKSPRAIQDALRSEAAQLRQDPQRGEYIPPRQIPNKNTLEKWQRRAGPVKNLYQIELPHGWRALYTAGSRGAERIVLILEVLDHKEYERAMGDS